MRKLAAVLLLVPLAGCGLAGGSGPTGPAPGSAGEQEMQEAMPETKLFDRNDGEGGP